MASSKDFFDALTAKALAAKKVMVPVLKDLVGPAAVLYVAVDKISRAFMGAAGNAKEMAKALAATESGRMLEIQFTKLTGSATLARKKVEELAKAAQTLPFSFEALGEAAKTLMVMSNGSMTSAKDLRGIADAAVAAGAPIEAVAGAIGELRSATDGANFNRWGDGVNSAVSQLTSLGVISQKTGKRLREMETSGATGGEIWATVQKDLERANGAAAKLQGTLSGMRKELENIQMEGMANVGALFENTEKAAARSEIAIAKFKSKVDILIAQSYAPITQAWEEIKEKFTSGVISMLQSIAPLGKAIVSFSMILNAYLIGQMTKFVGSAVLWVVKLQAFRMALMATGSLLARWAGFVNPATAALTLMSTAAIYLIEKLAAVNASLKNMQAGLDTRFKERSDSLTNLATEGAGSRTSEDREAVAQKVSDQIKSARASISEQSAKTEAARKDHFAKLTAMDKYNTGQDPLGNLLGPVRGTALYADAVESGAKLDTESSELAQQRTYMERLKIIQAAILHLKQNELALNDQLNQQLREQAKLAQDIKEGHTQNAIAKMPGEAGAQLAAQVAGEAKAKLEEAKAFTEAKGRDDKKLAQTQDELKVNRAAEANDPNSYEAAEKVRENIDTLGDITYDRKLNKATRISADIARRQLVRNDLEKAGIFSSDQLDKSRGVVNGVNTDRLRTRTAMIGGWEAATPFAIQAKENERAKEMEDQNVPMRMQKLTSADMVAQVSAEGSASGAAEISATQRRLDLERMISQIKMQGIYASQTELDLIEEAKDKEIEVLQEGKAALEMMERANKVLNDPKVTPQEREVYTEAANAAAIRAAESGVSGKTSEGVDSDIEQAKEAKKRRKEDLAVRRKRTADISMVSVLRSQEKYGETDLIRKGAREQADNLTETLRAEELQKQYTDNGMDVIPAQELALKTAQQEKLQTDIERDGEAPRMSSLAQVGGSAGWAGVVSGSEQKMEELRKVNSDMRVLLSTISGQYATGLALAAKLNKK